MNKLILIVAPVIILAGVFSFWAFKDEPVIYCTEDCGRVCNLDNECCYYSDCIPSSCSDGSKPMLYYKEHGSETGIVPLVYPDYINWTACIEPLPKKQGI